MLKNNASFMKKWTNVTWKSSLGMSAIPNCSSLELNNGLQQSFFDVLYTRDRYGFLLEQEVELKSIKMNYGKLLS